MEGDNLFSIAIRHHSEDQYHLGIYCKSEKSECIISLLDSYQVHKSTSFGHYKYLKFLQLEDDDEVIHMISVAEAAYEDKPCEVIYGPCGGGKFTNDGKYVGELGDGLTCSSFVLELIESQGFDLIDKSSWPLRDEDRNWQEETLEGLAESAISDEDHKHLTIQQTKCENGAHRFRPEEVGASVTFKDGPHCYEEINPVALRIIERITSK